VTEQAQISCCCRECSNKKALAGRSQPTQVITSAQLTPIRTAFFGGKRR
jgi:hypothetical protein